MTTLKLARQSHYSSLNGYPLLAAQSHHWLTWNIVKIPQLFFTRAGAKLLLPLCIYAMDFKNPNAKLDFYPINIHLLVSSQQVSLLEYLVSSFIFFFFFFCLCAISRTAPLAYGGSQARGRIGAVDAGLHQSHSHSGSELHLLPTPQLIAMPDP